MFYNAQTFKKLNMLT